jgi:hypothetical protein
MGPYHVPTATERLMPRRLPCFLCPIHEWTLAGRWRATRERGDGAARAGTVRECLGWGEQFAVLEALRKRTLFLPRDELEALCPRLDRLTAVGLSRRSPATRLFVAYLDALASMLPTLDRPAVVGARNATLELLAAALRPDVTAGGTSLQAGVHRGRRCATIARRSPTPRPVPRSTPSGSESSDRATPVAMCWWSVPSTGV